MFDSASIQHMNLINRLKNKTTRWCLPLPFQSRHMEYSVVSSLDDAPGGCSQRLVDISLEAIGFARHLNLSWLSQRMHHPPYYPEIWPGEHYKLLAGLVLALKPKRVLEIGTAQGLSALAMKGSLPAGSELITLDLVPWTEFAQSVLLPSDFEDGGLRQLLGDLSDNKFFSSLADTVSTCDLIFVDAPKDSRFERAFLGNLSSIRIPQNALVVFDDIRHWNMLRIWREITRPKLDLTSFGHWSGTGLIDWNG
jgi:predicted O-methyltransferase YrrM